METAPPHKVGHFVLVVPAVHAERLTDFVPQARACRVEFHVEQVAVVVQRCEALVHSHADVVRLFRQVWTQRGFFQPVRLAEHELPCRQRPRCTHDLAAIRGQRRVGTHSVVRQGLALRHLVARRTPSVRAHRLSLVRVRHPLTEVRRSCRHTRHEHGRRHIRRRTACLAV